MNQHNQHFQVKHVLDGLRAEFGDSDFGYRVQALFAHVLLRLGAGVREINQQGHPDIRAELNGQLHLIQVKSISHSNVPCSIVVEQADLAGIKPTSVREAGCYAILDCANPPSWVIVDYLDMERHSTRPVNMETVRACANQKLSRECSDEFTDIVLANKTHLHLLKYRTLCDRALRGDVL